MPLSTSLFYSIRPFSFTTIIRFAGVARPRLIAGTMGLSPGAGTTIAHCYSSGHSGGCTQAVTGRIAEL